MSKTKLGLAIAIGALVLIMFTAVIATVAAGGSAAGGSAVQFDLNLKGVKKENAEIAHLKAGVSAIANVHVDAVSVEAVQDTDAGCKAKIAVIPHGTSAAMIMAAVTLTDTVGGDTLEGGDGVGDDEAKNALFVEAFKTAGLKDCAGVSTSTPVTGVVVPVVTSIDNEKPGAGADAGAGAGAAKCTPPKSVEPTCKRCLDSGQCKTGFCCPYMKLCVASSSQGCGGAARCNPRCFKATGCVCSADDAKNWPTKWKEPTCISRLRQQ